ncbi:unnamed protein product [Larinioides sclopetarius]|uniref:Transposase n=1 Tax=Larinioides sclopetarius TaxID=280406 RepID=A0AAV2BYB7_9ARAC
MPLNTVEDVWIVIMERAPQHEKLSKFIDYFIEQWMDNPLLPIALWNVNDQRHRTNNTVEELNSKLNRMIGRQQPNVQLLVKCLKGELGEFGVKRKKKFGTWSSRTEQGLSPIMKRYKQSGLMQVRWTGLIFGVPAPGHCYLLSRKDTSNLA